MWRIGLGTGRRRLRHYCCLDLYRAKNSAIHGGTILSVIGSTADDEGRLVVRKGAGYVIVEPDQLFSSTSIVDQLWCDRSAAFAERIKMPMGNEAMLRGVIGHELLSAVSSAHSMFLLAPIVCSWIGGM